MRKLTPLLKAVCNVNEVSISDVKSKSRKRILVDCRREYCFLANELTSETQEVISTEINLTTAMVVYHRGQMKNLLNLPGINYRPKLELIKSNYYELP